MDRCDVHKSYCHDVIVHRWLFLLRWLFLSNRKPFLSAAAQLKAVPVGLLGLIIKFFCDPQIGSFG